MNIARNRLASQHLSRPVFDDPGAVVRWMGAVQSQDFLGGLWGVGLRTRGATEASVEAAIARRAFVRTWPMRGTLHFVAAPDARWMLKLLTPRVIALAAGRYRQLELTDAVFARAARAVERALVGGKIIRRDAFAQVLSSAGIATTDSRGLHILGHLAMTGLLCFGPRDGKQHTVTLLDEWLPPVPPLARDEALGELARRYFTSHGPATAHDFAWWSGLTVRDARAGIELAGSELEGETVHGRAYWAHRSTPSRGAAPRAHLLPAWDEYTVAYRDRDAVLDRKHATKVNAGGGILKPVIVVRGRVVGSWQRTLGRDSVIVTPAPFTRLEPADARAVERAVRAYAAFLGLKPELRMPPPAQRRGVTTGSH
ncbi:MAG TPA: winged helix DNA-binding domain-containing protein [Gemmatimonadaceae bacterium]|jgi:hypothetical protein|nr:winged helix DNA-binding domain-containing protein [Gemmatimonadaceae bacterium]